MNITIVEEAIIKTLLCGTEPAAQCPPPNIFKNATSRSIISKLIFNADTKSFFVNPNSLNITEMSKINEIIKTDYAAITKGQSVNKLTQLLKKGHFLSEIENKFNRLKNVVKLSDFESQSNAAVTDMISQIDHEARSTFEDSAAKNLLQKKEISMSDCNIKELIDSVRATRTSTGFKFLDEATNGGIAEGEVAVIAGRVTLGKTTLALNIILHMGQELYRKAWSEEVANKDKNTLVLYFSPDMHISQVLIRFASITMGKSPKELATMEGEFIRNEVNKTNIDLVAISEDRIDKIMAIVKKRSRPRKTIIVIDYLQQIYSSRSLGANRSDEIGKIINQLKSVSIEKGCRLFIISQLNRNELGVIPSMASLKSSGAVEQDPDLILMVYEMNGKSFINIAKNRNGSVGQFPVNFNKSCFTITQGEAVELDHSISQAPTGDFSVH